MGKKKDKTQDQGDTPQKKTRVATPRRSLTRTRARIVARQKRHEHQQKRKWAKLEKRIERLAGLLHMEWEIEVNHNRSVSQEHRRLWRRARRAGLVGAPLARNVPQAVDPKVATQKALENV